MNSLVICLVLWYSVCTFSDILSNCTSMAKCWRDVMPLLMHWSYKSFAYIYIIFFKSHFQFLGEQGYPFPITPRVLQSPSKKDFLQIFEVQYIIPTRGTHVNDNMESNRSGAHFSMMSSYQHRNFSAMNYFCILIEIYTFSFTKCFWKCRLEYGGQFILASMS